MIFSAAARVIPSSPARCFASSSWGRGLVHEARLARGGNISSKRRALERIQRIEPGRSGLSYSGI
jgi:hypothetical protein